MLGEDRMPDDPLEVLGSCQSIKALRGLAVKNKNAPLSIWSPIALNLSEFSHVHWVMVMMMMMIIIMDFFGLIGQCHIQAHSFVWCPSRETKLVSNPGGETGHEESPLSLDHIYRTL